MFLKTELTKILIRKILDFIMYSYNVIQKLVHFFIKNILFNSNRLVMIITKMNRSIHYQVVFL